MTAPPKLSSEERRAAILRAVRGVFAEKGFDGTTTRALADAAGVSEALLFKHFPNKEALFTAMQQACCTPQDQGRFERLTALPPSAATLVKVVQFLVNLLVVERRPRDDDRVIQQRLMLRSLAEDGEFARLLLRKLAPEWVPRVEDCLRVAVAAGQAADGPVRADLGAWFVHHLAAMVMLLRLPERPAVDHGAPRDQLVEQITWFVLRGLGLKENFIRRHLRPPGRSMRQSS